MWWVDGMREVVVWGRKWGERGRTAEYAAEILSRADIPMKNGKVDEIMGVRFRRGQEGTIEIQERTIAPHRGDEEGKCESTSGLISLDNPVLDPTILR
jgi:hypothetical protein